MEQKDRNQSSATLENSEDDVVDVDWEEWDGVSSPFWIHCVAGSVAGVMEHGLTYPLDTVRTHIQVCAACINKERARMIAAADTTARNSVMTNALGSSSSRQCQLQQQVPLGSQNGKNVSSEILSLINNSSLNHATINPTSASSNISHAAKSAMKSKLPLQFAQQPELQQLPLGMWQTIRYLVSQPLMTTSGAAAFDVGSSGSASSSLSAILSNNTSSSAPNVVGWQRLWRGVTTVLVGCVPAHALYFSSYELVKRLFAAKAVEDDSNGTTLLPAWVGSSLAGAAATLGHDCVMTPIDTIKQRMQLGYFYSNSCTNGNASAGSAMASDGIIGAFRSIIRNEGLAALYRSFPVTLASNVPYGMIMVTTNETCRTFLTSYYSDRTNVAFATYGAICANSPSTPSSTVVVLLSSSVAGFVASACTTPLDRIKTSLQTQQLVPNCVLGKAFANHAHSTSALNSGTTPTVVTRNWYQAAQLIYTTEGAAGFFRGITPRVLSHTPAVAISWTTYETAKQYLLKYHHQ